jgi:lysophospholipase L1-like esterase
MRRTILVVAFFLGACATSPSIEPYLAKAPPASESLPPYAPFRDEILRFAEVDRATPPPPCPVLFVGSSSIRMWRTLSEDMAPMPVINRGFGGSTIGQSTLYFDRIVAPYRPRAIVFYAGENDIDGGQSPADAASQFRIYLAKKRATLGRTPVFYISAKPSKLRFSQFARQTELNDAIRDLAAANPDLTFIDVVPSMLSGGRPRDIYVEDGLHMNAAGYAIWRGLVRQALANRHVERLRCRP